MALPTLEKTWQFNVNQVIGGKGQEDNDNRDTLFKIKESLVGFPSGHWTVASSSNGSTVADTDDNWDAYTDLRFASSGNHSWIVLTNSATGAEICIDCLVSSGSTEDVHVRWSPGGGYATDGTLTARPTPPADERTLDLTDVGGLHVFPWVGRLHAMMSDDGECTRVVVCRNSVSAGFWYFDTAKPSISAWTNPVVACVINGGSVDALRDNTFNAAANLQAHIDGYVSLFMTIEATSAETLIVLLNVPDDDTGEWFMSPIGLLCVDIPHRGRKGSLYDFWWGAGLVRKTGDSYPADGTHQFVQFGDMILPWNGSYPRVT